MFKFAENIVSLRKRKGITQEQLAEFLGVTKASVSKWETKQSMPDISLLPMIASFFDVSIDEILGYQPELSVEEIEKIYAELTKDFTRMPFEDVIHKSEALVKQYFNCYPFLLQMAILWLNHYVMAESRERQVEILQKAAELCEIVMNKGKDTGKRNQALVVNAYVLLMMGKFDKVIEMLKEFADPMGVISQSQNLLIQAYMAKGDTKQAKQYNQLLIGNDIFGIISHSTNYLAGNMNDKKVCLETIDRVLKLIEIYNVININPNTVAGFLIHAALVYAQYDMKEDFLKMMEMYVRAIDVLFGEEIALIKSDEYFDVIESEYMLSDEIKQVPRDKKIVFESALSIFEQAAFEKYKEEKRFKELKQIVLKKGEKICS